MSDIVVIYASHYGFAEAYARWVAEDLQAELLEAGKVGRENLAKYGTIVYGGGLYAGGINGISLLVKNAERLRGKKLYLFTVGASDPTDPENIANIRNGIAKALPPTMLENRHCPEQDTHSAPWTKTSSSAPRPAQARISSRFISRASTTRSKPCPARNATPARLCTAICVLAWSGSPGATRRMTSATPKSCTSTASAPAAAMARTESARAGISS